MVTKLKFETGKKEKIIAVLMYFSAYVYCSAFFETGVVSQILFGIFIGAFLVLGEVLFWEKRRSAESIIFFAAVIIIGVAGCFEIGQVWETPAKIFFLHLFAVYWVLLRSECLAEGKTSHLFLWDGINGFIVMPFKNFFLGIRTVATIFKGGKKRNIKILLSVLASIIGLALFIFAMILLKESDSNFAAMMGFLDINWDFQYIIRAVISLFIASYLYGLLGGCYRAKEEEIKKPGVKINETISRLNKIPGAVWLVFIGLFSVFYIIFFILQGSYMLNAFAMLLPEKFTFSQYARKGFGEMCVVMIINLILMWLASRTSEKKGRLYKIFGTVLIGESLIFALIAFLKILMYIRAYGFTPLRLQSVWLVLVLSYACVCILITIFSGKKTARIWFTGSASALAVLTLI